MGILGDKRVCERWFEWMVNLFHYLHPTTCTSPLMCDDLVLSYRTWMIGPPSLVVALYPSPCLEDKGVRGRGRGRGVVGEGQPVGREQMAGGCVCGGR